MIDSTEFERDRGDEFDFEGRNVEFSDSPKTGAPIEMVPPPVSRRTHNFLEIASNNASVGQVDAWTGQPNSTDNS